MYDIPDLSIVFMGISAFAGIAIPVILFLLFRKKYKADKRPFFIGCAVFFVFAIILEGTINNLIFSSALGSTIRNNIWVYAVFGGLMAGVFEETGRFAAFKTVLKNNRNNDHNGLMYGAGHGGFEAFYILFFSMVSYIFMAVQLNAGMYESLTSGIDDPAMLQKLEATFVALEKTAPVMFLVGIIERFAAVGLHLSLAVMVWFAAKNPMRLWLYPFAIFIHAFVNALAVILADKTRNILLVEAVIYILVAISAVIAFRVWKKSAAEYVQVQTAELEQEEYSSN